MMAPASKAKAAGVSASSFFDLKAQLAKREEEVLESKAAGKVAPSAVQRRDKKISQWARQNKGVKSRAARDIELEAVDEPTLESARAALERKAKIYDKLRKGKSGGLTDKQFDMLLVDFDSKPMEAFESDSEDIDESLTVPKPLDEADPVIEYEDEFGRLRTAPRSEVPRHLLPRSMKGGDDGDDDEGHVIENPVNFFPVYEPSAERTAAINEALEEQNKPLNTHYDSTREVRAKGAGFYQFSADEETRKKQMEELLAARGETERNREDLGAVDLKPGEVDGLQASGHGLKGRATEKRKRELEERRQLLDVKRRKGKGKAEAVEEQKLSQPIAPSPSMDEAAKPPTVTDPFVALESQRPKPYGSTAGPIDTDAFLADIEQTIIKGRRPS